MNKAEIYDKIDDLYDLLCTMTYLYDMSLGDVQSIETKIMELKLLINEKIL